MKTYRYPDEQTWTEIVQRPVMNSERLQSMVRSILDQVKSQGDAAIRQFAKEFDNVEIDNFMVSSEELMHAVQNVKPEFKMAVKHAYRNIEKFHKSQKEKVKIIETSPGVQCWRTSTAIQKVGLYIPGGTAPLFSTVLMLGIPAKLAGCEEIILCTPPNPQEQINEAILYCAHMIGLERIYKIGGAQAIGAMAYGTKSIPRVEKIFGPGNQYVTMAKQLVNLEGIAIDMPAGPSEVVVVADHTANPKFIAADLLSQAEHGIDSQVIFITTQEDLLMQVQNALTKQMAKLPRRKIANEALKNSSMVILKNIDQAIELVNKYAPEHLILMVKHPRRKAHKIKNAGSVFLGSFTPESAGDYVSGTNHTLPTNGMARSYSGVSLESFMKKITFQQISRNGLENLADTINIMAETEDLNAHKIAVQVRLQKGNERSDDGYK